MWGMCNKGQVDGKYMWPIPFDKLMLEPRKGSCVGPGSAAEL